MRFLFVAQEPYPGYQIPARQSFDQLLGSGEMECLSTFSFVHESATLGPAAASSRLFQSAAAFQPDVILWQTVKDFPVTRRFLQELKGLPSKPLLVYCEEDAWGGLRKRLTTSMKALAKEADIVYLHGLGQLARLFRKAGARKVAYFPFYADTIRFGKPWQPAEQRTYDVVMIGGYYRSRVPLVGGIPGAKERFELARKLGHLLGDRFALFGPGWPSWPFAKGPRRFSQQEMMCRQAWVTVNWEHYNDLPYYFSDRLPVALLAGVPHVTNSHVGYGELFPADSGVYFGRTPDDIVDSVTFLLSKSPQELIALGRRGARLAEDRFTAPVVWGNVIRSCMRLRTALLESVAGGINGSVSDHGIDNDWREIGSGRLEIAASRGVDRAAPPKVASDVYSCGH